MDRQQQQNVEQAAQQFTDALVSSFRALSDRTVGSQEQAARLTENFFNQVVNNLRSQAQNNREMTQRLAEQQQRTQEATQQLTQQSVGAYMDLLNSMFSYSRGSIEAGSQVAQQGVQAAGQAAQQATQEAASQATQQSTQEEAAGQAAQQEREETSEPQEVLATQKARRRAQDLGVDLAEIEGTGDHGQITVADVNRKAKERQS